MDALKLIEQGSMKAEAPKIEIGDLVKVHVKICLLYTSDAADESVGV